MSRRETAKTYDGLALALGGRTIIPGLAVGHSVFHWSVQCFVVALPEIQQTFGLSGVGVGGILAAREFATAIVKLPGGVAVNALRRYWGTVLSACLGASALGLLVLDSGVLLTVCVALLGLFLYPDQPILTAAVFDAVLYYVAGLFGLAAVVFVGAPGAGRGAK